MQFGQVIDSLFSKGFRGPKCKTLLKLAMSRIKLLRNKREMQLKQSRRELAQLLKDGQEPTARIRVEHVIREQNIMQAYDIIELYCELLVVRIPMIESQRECPLDLQEAVASLIFAAPRSSDLPELLEVQNMFAIKYGREFVATAAELRPDCRVNRQIIEKMSARAPSMQFKLNTLKEIAEENAIEWDFSNTELEFSKLPEDLLDGPNRFVSATMLPLIPSNEDESPSTTIDLAKIKPTLQEKSSSFSSTAGLGSRHQSIDTLAKIKPTLQEKSSSFGSTAGLGSRHQQSIDSLAKIKSALQEKRSSFSSTARLGSRHQSTDSFEEPKFIPFLVPPKNEKEPAPNGFYSPPRETSLSQKSGLVEETLLGKSLPRARSEGSMNLQDIIEAAEAAAESAEKAAQAARAAADLARSRLSPTSEGHNKNEGMSQLNSDTEKESPSKIESKPPYNEETGDMKNDFQVAPENDDDTQDHQRVRNKQDSGSYDVFDISAENVQNDEPVHVAEPGREKESIFDTDEDYDFSVSSSQAPTTKGGSREGQQIFDDAPGTVDSETTNHVRQPSPEDDSYYSYPNLFGKPSGPNY